jgi:succinate dehydrogenase hydrophobic anchor subunit
MSGQTRPAGRFLGRPEGAYPGFVPDRPVEPEDRRPVDADVTGSGAKSSRASRMWLMQALTGGLLVVFLGIHLVAQHLLAPGGLRDHASVVAYLRQPLALAAEIGLLLAVVTHAGLGLRAGLVDVIHDARAMRLASLAIAFAGLVAMAYLVWLTFSVVNVSP